MHFWLLKLTSSFVALMLVGQVSSDLNLSHHQFAAIFQYYPQAKFEFLKVRRVEVQQNDH